MVLMKNMKKNELANNATDYIDRLETYLLETINTTNNQFVSEKGEVERWKGGVNKKELTKEIDKAVSSFRDSIKQFKKSGYDKT